MHNLLKPCPYRHQLGSIATIIPFAFDNLCHSNSKSLVIDHDDLSTSNQSIIHVNITRLSQLSIKFDDGTTAQLCRVPH
jgi:hypothetical protein